MPPAKDHERPNGDKCRASNGSSRGGCCWHEANIPRRLKFSQRGPKSDAASAHRTEAWPTLAVATDALDVGSGATKNVARPACRTWAAVVANAVHGARTMGANALTIDAICDAAAGGAAEETASARGAFVATTNALPVHCARAWKANAFAPDAFRVTAGTAAAEDTARALRHHQTAIGVVMI